MSFHEHILLPDFLLVDDYHELDSFINLLNRFDLSRRIKVKEIGFSYSKGKYIGLVYAGERPTERQIREMLSDKKIELTE